jgi:hypothetical protein
MTYQVGDVRGCCVVQNEVDKGKNKRVESEKLRADIQKQVRSD